LKNVAILGSTGSIGTQALDVLAAHPNRFAVVGLAAGENIPELATQAERFRPRSVSAGTQRGAEQLRVALDGAPCEVAHGREGLELVAAHSGADIVLVATDGMVSFRAALAALAAGVDLALANKELAVAAGELLFAEAAKSGARILPVDSEHSAVFQCLQGEETKAVRTVVLTASGGPFWNLSREQMRDVTPSQALRHPTWSMGAKNTLDSATLMNKGLEVIEASRFFGLAPAQIEVVIHRASFAHAFVMFADGSVKAQLAQPDMRVPIGYALAWPERLPAIQNRSTTVDLYNTARAQIGLGGEVATLTFEPVDVERFPAIPIAYRALERGGTYPAALSAANEEAGRAFLDGKIKFTDIASLVERALEAEPGEPAALPAIEAADARAREFVKRHLGDFSLT